MRFQTIIISVILILLALTACRDKGTEPYVKSIWLSAEDVGVTDAFIHVILSNDNKSSNFSLKLNGNTILSANTRDTLIYSDSLLPKHTYTYKAYRLNGAIVFDSSDALTITTMDTTSHNFKWDIDMLGDGNSSVLYDVAIINDTLAYAVGEISIKDTLGSWIYPPFNLAKWDGKKWWLSRVLYQGGYAPIKCIFASSENDVWFGMGYLVHWDGNRYTSIEVPPFYGVGSNKMWRSPGGEIYVVGNNGTIAFSSNNGSSWEKMESGTDVNLTDVWGSPDGSVVWACGYNENNARTCLLRNEDSGWGVAYDGTNSRIIIRQDSLSGAYAGIYAPDTKLVYICSSAGVYAAPINTNGNGKRLSFTEMWFPGFPRSIRGNNRNDFTIAGDYTMMAHYNGVTWRYFWELRTSNMHFNAVAQRGNFIVGVGVIPDAINGQGFVARGRR